MRLFRYIFSFWDLLGKNEIYQKKKKIWSSALSGVLGGVGTVHELEKKNGIRMFGRGKSYHDNCRIFK